MADIEERKTQLALKLKQWRLQQSRARERNGKRKLTQKVVSEWLGLNQSLLSKLEAGVLTPDFLTLERLTYCYGKRLSQLRTLEKDVAGELNHYNYQPMFGITVADRDIPTRR